MNDPTPQARGLPDALLDPACYPHPVQGPVRCIETHISWVLIASPWAYKVKRPVAFDFLDFRTLAARRHYCEEELRLNRRLAPELYQEVVPVTRGKAGLRLGAGDGEIVDYAVRMVAFAAEDELICLLAAGDVQPAEMVRLARDIAAFQSRSRPCREGPVGDPARLQAAAFANFTALEGLEISPLPPRTLPVLAGWTRHSVAALEAVMRTRRAAGCVRDGHGDLHAGNILRWQGRLVPFDCIEFDPALRCLDVMADVAFLVMDLASRGRSDLGQVFLNEWVATTGDLEALRLLPFFVVYFSMVRAKVDALQLREARGTRGSSLRGRMRAHLELALRWAAPSPRWLMLMHGVSGSGKSWLAGRLAPRLPALQLRADVERRRLAGIGERERTGAAPGTGIYTEAFSDRTYARLLAGAEAGLAGGQHVIVDATFLDAARRAPFRQMAAARGARFLILHCAAAPAVCEARVRSREAEASDASEAGVEVLARQLDTAGPLPAAEQQETLEVDTTGTDVEFVVRQINERLAVAPGGN